MSAGRARAGISKDGLHMPAETARPLAVTSSLVRRRRLALLVGVLLSVFALQSLDLARRTSATGDESGHLIAGLSWWVSGRYEYKTLNLFFAQKWGALPIYLTGAQLPPAIPYDFWPPNAIGETFLFSMGYDPVWLLGLARAMIMLLGLILGLLIFVVNIRVFEEVAALAALALYVMCPPLVANASLMTTDMAVTLWLFAASVAYWYMLEKPSPTNTFIAGACLGLLLLTKFTAVIYVPISAMLLCWHLWVTPRGKWGGRIRPWLLAHVGCALIAWAAIWTFFGFKYNPGDTVYNWPSLGQGTLLAELAGLLRSTHLLPAPYIHELVGLRLLFMKHYNYLDGQMYLGGHWQFFPIAFLLKTPVPLLLILALAALLSLQAVRHPKPMTAEGAVPFEREYGRIMALWLGIGVFFALAMQSNVNIGHRHILPIYPPLFVLAGGAVAWLWRRVTWGRFAVTGLLVAAALEAAILHPREHAYFNAFAGGPGGGYRWLVDSSLSQGADLPQLAPWEAAIRQREPTARFYLVESSAYPAAYGSTAIPIILEGDPGALGAGYLIFDATTLICGPLPFQGPYTAEYETIYQNQRQLVARASPTADLGGYRQLAACRLAAFCRRRPVDARIGDVYFVFHLSQAEVQEALNAPLPVGLPEPTGAASYPRRLSWKESAPAT